MHDHVSKYINDTPVALPRGVKFPEMVKLHCLLMLHLHDIAAEFNTIGVLAEESIESIHAIWNRFARRNFSVRGEKKERAISHALASFQDADVMTDLEEAFKATSRFSVIL
mmetsp:Transcript_7462/g.16332  ORF Transcript_7462/g.16332 Transcript_7462/m.16332 type:complete len:111 (-) Transcript_7462:620-952(-)